MNSPYYQYSTNENSRIFMSRYGKNLDYDDYDDYDDCCEECQVNTSLYNCNKCARSICDAAECCVTFPHYYNTTYFICNGCFDEISLKLTLQIDLGKLELLKEKIRTGTTCNSVCSSRANSRSSCSTNLVSISSISDESTISNNVRRNSITSSDSDEFVTFAKKILPID